MTVPINRIMALTKSAGTFSPYCSRCPPNDSLRFACDTCMLGQISGRCFETIKCFNIDDYNGGLQSPVRLPVLCASFCPRLRCVERRPPSRRMIRDVLRRCGFHRRKDVCRKSFLPAIRPPVSASFTLPVRCRLASM